MMIIIGFTPLTINVFGQTTNSTIQDNQTSYKAEPNKQQFKERVVDKEMINVSSKEFNQLLDEIKGSINLIEDKKYDAAASKLGLAIIDILNSTQQYQELVQFASSQYVYKMQQQQFNDDKSSK